jgi:hypothetical protein
MIRASERLHTQQRKIRAFDPPILAFFCTLPTAALSKASPFSKELVSMRAGDGIPP